MPFKKSIVLIFGAIFFVFLILAFSTIAHRKEMMVARQIEQGGGSVTFVGHGPIWLIKALGGIYPFKSVQTVEFGMRSTDSDMALVVPLKQTRAVFLNGTEITGAGLSYLQDMPNLHEIELTGSAITDEGLKQFAHLPSIERLTLARTGISDQGIVYIAQLPKLHELSLAYTKVSDLCLPYLARLPLKQIDLTGTLITSNGMKYLRQQNSSLDVIH